MVHFGAEQERSFGRERLSRKGQNLLREEEVLQKSLVVQRGVMPSNARGIQALPQKPGQPQDDSAVPQVDRVVGDRVT